ncbi:MAG: hypothetical protein GX484_17780 [Chloroflexi bacterium]|nr:hypothetical protein [Chloroflexota bacterium]
MAQDARPNPGMMTDAADLRRIHAALETWGTRLRLQQSAVWLPRGLAIGLAVAVLAAVAARIWPLMPRPRLILLAGLLALAGALGALLTVWVWPRTRLKLARRFDRAFGLRERLTTALEIAEGMIPAESPVLAAAQRRDAAQAADRGDPRRLRPLRTDGRSWALAGAALLLVAAALIYPNPQDDVLAERVEVEQAIAEQLEMLEALREEAIEDPALAEDQRTELVETLDEAIETLSQRDLTREEAFAALNAAERELQDLTREYAEARREALQGRAEQFERAGAGEAAQRLQEGDFQSAGEALAEMLDNLSDEQMAGAADELDRLADELEDIDPELAEALREAAEALRRGDRGAAREALEQAGERLAGAGGQGDSPLSEYAERLRQSQQEMAQAGQPGQGGMGQAQPGGQQGQGGTGQGQGEGDGLDPGQLTGDTPRGGGAPDGGEREAEIYAPQRIGGEGGEQMDIPGDPDSVPVQEGEFADNPTGESTVPYSEVYGDYSESVNEALDTGRIPLGMRGLVQKYFSRLDPGE